METMEIPEYSEVHQQKQEFYTDAVTNNHPTQKQHPTTTRISADFSVVFKPSNVMMLVNIVLLLLTACTMAGWRWATHVAFWLLFVDGYNFFIFTILLPFFLLVFFIVIFVLKIEQRMPSINMQFVLMLNCIVWALFLMISSSIVLGQAYSELYRICKICKLSHIVAVGVFGFICVIGLIIQAILLFIEIRGTRS